MQVRGTPGLFERIVVRRGLNYLILRSGRIRKPFLSLMYDSICRYRPDDWWRFMNYGYAEVGTSDGGLLGFDAGHEPERFALQMYELAARAVGPLGSRTLVEVGSGRGGGLSWLARTGGPSLAVGIDLSGGQVRFCHRHHGADGIQFVQGDAERLPIASGRADVVLNIESSHCYPELPRFVGEVARVLRPGGRLFLADFRDRGAVDALRAALRHRSLRLEKEWNLTAGVLRALELDEPRKQALISQAVHPLLRPLFRRFAGCRGSSVQEGLRAGTKVYTAFLVRKVS